MPQGDKRKYTDKQKREAEHIADGYEARGVSEKEATSRAWATVNKQDGGGNKRGGSGYGKPKSDAPAKRGGAASAADRSASAKKAAATRKEHAAQHS